MLHIGLLRVMSNEFGTYVCIFSLTFFSAVVNVYFYSLISSSSTRPARPALELMVDIGVLRGPRGGGHVRWAAGGCCPTFGFLPHQLGGEIGGAFPFIHRLESLA